MHADELHRHCLSFPGSAETFPFGSATSVFKVVGKMFALSRLDENPLRVSLKCEPDVAQQLREAHAGVIPGYHLNTRHCTAVMIDSSVADQMIMDMIEDSYDLVVSKLAPAHRRALGWHSAMPDRG